MLSTGTYALGDKYEIVVVAPKGYVMATQPTRPNDETTESVRKEARTRWRVAITLGPWKEQATANTYKAIIVTCIPARRG